MLCKKKFFINRDFVYDIGEYKRIEGSALKIQDERENRNGDSDSRRPDRGCGYRYG